MTAKDTKEADMEVKRRVWQAPNPETLRSIQTLNRMPRELSDGVVMPALSKMIRANKNTGQFVLDENAVEYEAQLKSMRKAAKKWGYVEIDAEDFGKVPDTYKPEIKDPTLLQQEIEDKDKVIASKDEQIRKLQEALENARGTSGKDDKKKVEV